MGLRQRLHDLAVDTEVAKAIDRVSADEQLNALGYDPWGFQADVAKVYFSLAKQIYRYFRPRLIGIDNLPRGRMLVVPNHSGQLPFDALVVSVACLIGSDRPRLLRAMAERWVPTLPMVNVAFSRSGVVLGDPINCRNLLDADRGILVFPEGTRGSGKTFWNRYQLASFGRGFMRLALQTKTPVVPVGIVGAEESIVSVADLKPLADLLRMPYAPVPALLPLLGPLAFLPLPTRFHIHFGEPIQFEGPFDDEDEVIDQKVAVVEKAVAELIDRGRRERAGWFT